MAHYTLYYKPGTNSLVVHWLLLELEAHGVTHDLRVVDFANKDAEFVRLNPLGRVPVLVADGGSPISECTAILMFLAERHPGARFAPPADDPSRGQYLEQMVFLANTFLPAIRYFFYAGSDGNPAAAPDVKALASTYMYQGWDVLDQQLARRQYLRGDGPPGVDDFLAAYCARVSRNFEKTALDWPNVSAFVGRMTGRPSWRKVLEAEGLPMWP